MNWRFHFAVVAAACAVLPFVVPQHSLTILVEALIFGLFAMSLDLLVGYRTRMWSDKIVATIQLNARNVGQTARLQPVASFPDGTKSAYRIVDPTQYILSLSFDL